MEQKNVYGYVQNSDGKWILSEEAKAQAKALYYSGRLAYNSQDPRHAIGRYNEHGEIIPFKPWPSKIVAQVQK